jgi:hypothetical protein
VPRGPWVPGWSQEAEAKRPRRQHKASLVTQETSEDRWAVSGRGEPDSLLDLLPPEPGQRASRFSPR